jgi:hypothetical protein
LGCITGDILCDLPVFIARNQSYLNAGKQ